MRNVKIITDSCADLNAELLERYDIDYAEMRTVYQGKETPAKLTWSEKEVHDLYNIMRNGERITTTQVPVEEFMRVFKKYLDMNMDIVYIGCSAKSSGSVNTGHVTAQKLMEEYQGSEIYCIDSLNASIGEGMLVIEAAKLAGEGKSAREINDAILAKRNLVNEYVTVHSLTALRRAGRVKGSAAFFGNLMGVKPIIIADANGDQAAYKKVKGRANSFNEIVAMLKESIIAPETQTVYIAHGDCNAEELKTLTDMVKAQIPCKDIYTVYIGPIVGASIGPDAIGVWGFGKEVTYKNGDEK